MCIRDSTNPVDESRKIIDQIKGQVDVIVGVMHMDVENEYGVYGSGVTDLANACPEFDVIVASPFSYTHLSMVLRE